MKKYLFVVLVFVLIGSASLMADYYVDPSGTDDLNPGRGSGPGQNAWKTIQFAVNNVSDPTTATIMIHVSGYTYTLNSVEIYIGRGFGSISGGLTIRGAGAGSTIIQAKSSSGTANGRVFFIDDNTVTLEDMTIRYGNLNSGAGIYNNEGTLTLIDCTVIGNTCNSGGGGGIDNFMGTLTMTNCTVSGNTSNSGYGGGICNDDGTLKMTNCTVSGNNVYNHNDYTGGGLYNTGAATITNCTFANNTAPGNSVGGAGLYQRTGTIYIKNTIIANNSSGGYDDFYKDEESGGTVTNNGYNIVETQNQSDFVNGVNGCIVGAGTYNLSTTLEENNTTNGTLTLRTTTSSAAINAGDPSNTANNSVAIPTTDQRGANRNGITDIGAYEYWDDDGSLPVTLSSFTVQYLNESPVLCWTTQSETSNAGWNIYRGESNEALSNEETYQLNLSLGLIPGAGTTSEPTDYNFEDVFPVYDGITYYYWLESVDYSGESEIYGPISLTIPENEWQNPNSPEIPKPYGLHQNYPNPFNPNTEISFMMNENCIGDLSIFNTKGQKIKTIFTTTSIPRDELIISKWNGKDESGKEVSTGVYYYKLQTTKGNYVRKMILMK